MSATYYRYDGSVITPIGLAVDGCSIAVLTQPASFATQPGSPLASIFAANASNSATIVGALWAGGQITFTFSTTPPADVVAGSYIAVSGVTPSTFNTTLSAPYLVVAVNGNNVIVAELTSPGTWISGGTVATSVLPNPTSADNNGNYFFYALPGIYSLQIYSPTITERDLPDQSIGTVAGGSVLSVGLALPVQFTVSGSPVTTSGTLTGAWATEAANLVFAGPATGAAAAPTFRALVAADFPGGTGTVSSVAHTLTVPNIFSASVTGSPVTTSGTLADTITLATQTANQIWAGPTSGGPAAPTFRSLVASDIPQVIPVSPITVLSGSADTIASPSLNAVVTAGVNAMSLFNPGGGEIVTVIDTSGHAHTITTNVNKIIPSHDLVTFDGTVGSFIQLQGLGTLGWAVLANSGVVIS